jgi:hypothetical protein
MKHESTRTVFDYWTQRRGDRAAPERSEIDPAAIRHALGDTFMLAADFVDLLRFRLAGTRVCALFCREIKGDAFDAAWIGPSRKSVEELLDAVTGEAVGAVAGLVARTADGSEADLELLLLPLAHSGHARIRALGVLTPIVPPYWLGEKPVCELELRTLRHVGADVDGIEAPLFALHAGATHVRHGFVVYSGGREPPSAE